MGVGPFQQGVVAWASFPGKPAHQWVAAEAEADWMVAQGQGSDAARVLLGEGVSHWVHLHQGHLFLLSLS